MSNAVRVERKLTAILAADVQGYSRLMGADEEGTLHMLTAYREITDAFIQQHRGRIVGTAGDSILAEFASAVDAVQCAMAIQQALKTKNADLPPEHRMEFRIGINVGDVIVEGAQIYGDGVNIAARLEALAEGGGICISGTVYDQVETKLSLGYEILGEQTVKNIAKPVRVYRVGEPGTTATIDGKGDATAPGQTSAFPLPDKPSIIVLPFVNLSNDPEQEYFSDGLTEDLTADLSRLSSLFVIARNSAFTYKGKAVKVQEVSKEMGVRYVLEGSVRKAGDQVRVTAQLIDATTGGHLWSERYDRPLKEIFALQDEITQKIVLALKVKLTKEGQERFRRIPTDNLEAYDYLLRGGAYLTRFTKEATAQARQMFEKALELDPQYAAAYGGLASTYWLEWFSQWNAAPQNLARAEELFQQAIVLDESRPGAHAVLGFIKLFSKQYEQATAETERALALDPNFANGYVNRAFVLMAVGRTEEAIEAAKKAVRLDPRQVLSLNALGQAYVTAGQYAEAIPVLKQALTYSPNHWLAHWGLAMSYSELGREEEARAAVAEMRRIVPQFSVGRWKRTAPYKDPTVTERFAAAMRKWGLE